jgi:hypothetical protein
MLARETAWTDRRTRLETRARIYAEEHHLSPRQTDALLLTLGWAEAEDAPITSEQLAHIVERCR